MYSDSNYWGLKRLFRRPRVAIERLGMGDAWADSDLVCISADGWNRCRGIRRSPRRSFWWLADKCALLDWRLFWFVQRASGCASGRASANSGSDSKCVAMATSVGKGARSVLKRRAL
jgi:hypothetical protein